MDKETLMIGGLATIVAALSAKPIAKAVTNGFRNYMHQVQEAYKGYGIAAQLTTSPFMELERYEQTKPRYNNHYKQAKQNIRIP